MTVERKRNAKATRDRIADAARQVFQSKGYDAATTREIAKLAGVNQTLIGRYFGSKLGLFEQAVVPYLNLNWALAGGPDEISRRLADYYVDAPKPDSFDGFAALIRSLGSSEVQPLLKEKLNEQALKPLRNSIEGADAEARAVLIATQLAGLIFWGRIMAFETDEHDSRDAMKDMLRRQVLSMLTNV